MVDPEGSGSSQDEPVVFGLLRNDWEQLVDEVMGVLLRRVSGFVTICVCAVVLTVSDNDFLVIM